MKTFRHLFFVAVLAGLLSSCMSLFTTVADQAERIERGMSMQQVRSVMGKPGYRRFVDNTEQWEYRSMLSGGDMDVVVVCFVDGSVISMNSFRERKPLLPQEPAKHD